MTELALAVDIGGTKLAVGLVDRSGTVVERFQVPTVSDGGIGGVGGIGGAEELWGRLSELVTMVVEMVHPDDVLVVCGVGCGGPMSPNGEGVSPLNIPAWRGFPLRSRLRTFTGLATFVDNDAKALALGEGWIGAAAGEPDYIAMVVSTGIGGGIVLDGRLLQGRLGNTGHVGHVVVVPDGRPCACGGQGCLEAEASGTGIEAMTGKSARLASAALVERSGTLVGRAVASVANLLDLPLAVVSGSVALGFGSPFFEAAQKEIDHRCGLEFARGTRIIPGGLGEQGPIIGAARVGWLGLGSVHDGGQDQDEDRDGNEEWVLI